VRTFLAVLLNLLLILTLNAQDYKKIYYNDIVNKLQPEEISRPLIFVDFWATWCAPCISSMPHTLNLQRQFKDKVSFVYISNEPSYKIKDFLKRKKYFFHALIDNKRKTEEEFDVQSIPNSFLLNPEGQIIWHGKPTEITEELLQSFVNFYENEKGSGDRFIYIKNDKKENEKWSEFSCNKSNLFFYEDPAVDNLFYQDKDEFFLSGEIKYIISFLNNYPIERVTYTGHKKHFRFKGKFETPDSFKKIIKKYLKKNHSYKIKTKEDKQEVYIVTDTTDSEFLNKQMYNYERGDAQFIQNDIGIKIDNASPKEMFIILNNITPLTFIYKGKNNKVYDWNIIYSPNEALLQQLHEDLNFVIEKKIKKVATYEIIFEKM